MRETGRRVDPPPAPAAPQPSGRPAGGRARSLRAAANDNRLAARKLALRAAVVMAVLIGVAILILTVR